MSNDFRQQLNKACRNKEDVLREQKSRENAQILNQVDTDYKQLKEQLLKEVSKGNFAKVNNKKSASCLYTSPYLSSVYKYKDGRSYSFKRFSKELKVKDTGIIEYVPRDSEQWDIYINEIKRLGNQDGITIKPVLRSSLYDLICNFPVSTSNKKFELHCGISLCLYCTVEF